MKLRHKKASQEDRTFAEEHEVVKQLEGLGGRLQQGNQDGLLLAVGQVPQELYDLVRGGRVQARRYLVLPGAARFFIARLGPIARAREEFTSKYPHSLWEHSSHGRLVGWGVPGVFCFSPVFIFSVRPPPGKNPQVPI